MDNLCKEVIKVKDVEDNTLLKLAISAKQYQVLDLLRDKGGLLGMVQGELLELLQVNAAADLESQQIVEVLGGGQSVDGIDTMLQEPRTHMGNLNIDRKQWQQPDQSTKNEPDNKSGNIQNAILVVASVIATVTFQAGLTPPPTIWRQDMNLDPKCIFQKSKNDTSIRSSFLTPINSCPALAFYSFMSFNTAAFLSSVCLLLLSSRSLGGPKASGLLMVSIYSMIFSYFTLVIAISPNFLSFTIIYVVSLCVITLGLARKLSAGLQRGRIKPPREEDGAP
ncbi:hypothetical protein L1049_018151 [Liquidambar formosana]|uniref:PGG domain-containing protein n=1 Tax=Liquidambar formosana TaxID=63359 RepID=A0AAP0R7R7_LIQFO